MTHEVELVDPVQQLVPLYCIEELILVDRQCGVCVLDRIRRFVCIRGIDWKLSVDVLSALPGINRRSDVSLLDKEVLSSGK